MRAWDLAVFIIFIEMAIGFFAILGDDPAHGGGGLFPSENYTTKYFTPETGGAVYVYQHTNATNTTGEVGGVDYLKFAIDWIFASFTVLFTIISAFVGISWILYSQFHLEPRLCFLIQGIVYFIYTWAFIQWRSGRGGKAFE
jgi:hypothetical protein